MKIKIDNIEFEIETKLPKKYENEASVQTVMNEWCDLFKKQKIEKKRRLRKEKIDKINEQKR